MSRYTKTKTTAICLLECLYGNHINLPKCCIKVSLKLLLKVFMITLDSPGNNKTADMCSYYRVYFHINLSICLLKFCNYNGSSELFQVVNKNYLMYSGTLLLRRPLLCQNSESTDFFLLYLC